MGFETLIVKRKTNNLISHIIIFRKFLKLKILIKYRYFIIINIIYNTNYLYKEIFTFIIKYKYKNLSLRVHRLYKYEDCNIIFVFLYIIQK